MHVLQERLLLLFELAAPSPQTVTLYRCSSGTMTSLHSVCPPLPSPPLSTPPLHTPLLLHASRFLLPSQTPRSQLKGRHFTQTASSSSAHSAAFASTLMATQIPLTSVPCVHVHVNTTKKQRHRAAHSGVVVNLFWSRSSCCKGFILRHGCVKQVFMIIL